MALVVDASASLAILRFEPDAQTLLEAIANADTVHISAATYVEIGAVVDAARDPHRVASTNCSPCSRS